MSSSCAAFSVLLIVLVAYPLINIIPVASLAGVMFCIVYHTFEWSSLKLIAAAFLSKQKREKYVEIQGRKVNRSDIFIVLQVSERSERAFWKSRILRRLHPLQKLNYPIAHRFARRRS